jgi:predicted enzyme involved in methoxymalonyl-ACP biosynthesis
LKALAVARAVDQLDEDDQLILGFLGASLLSLWDDLPAGEQQRLLNSQAIKSAFDRAEIKTRIQRLEEHFKRLK